MGEMALTGLVGSHPLGALAAFGLLRCCEEMEQFRGSRLGWRMLSDWHAMLTTDAPTTPENLVAALVARQGRRGASPEWSWADSIKEDAEKLRQALSRAREDLGNGERAAADFLAAFACELGADEQGRLEPTAFYMTSGQQKFLAEGRKLAGAVATGVTVGRRRKSPEELFREALFGPWRYEDPQHSLGLDPSAERLHALRARSPTREPSAGVSAAVWLALEALPLFPCFLSEGRLVTTSFHGGRSGAAYFSWPLWSAPISLAALRSLLSMGELAEDEPPRKELLARGVDAVFRSERYRVKTKGSYFILRPAFPCFIRESPDGVGDPTP